MYRLAIRRVLLDQLVTTVALVALTVLLAFLALIAHRDSRDGRSRPSVLMPQEPPR